MEDVQKTYKAFVDSWKENFPHISLDLVNRIARNKVLGYSQIIFSPLIIKYQDRIDNLKTKIDRLKENGIKVRDYGEMKVDGTESLDVEDKRELLFSWFPAAVTEYMIIDEKLIEKLARDKDISYVDEVPKKPFKLLKK